MKAPLQQQYDDAFLLKVARSATASCCSPHDCPFVGYVFMALKIFMRSCPTPDEICFRELTREFTSGRLEHVREEVAPVSIFKELVEPLSHIILALEILVTSGRSDDRSVREFTAYLVEEFTVENVRKIRSMATTIH